MSCGSATRTTRVIFFWKRVAAHHTADASFPEDEVHSRAPPFHVALHSRSVIMDCLAATAASRACRAPGLRDHLSPDVLVAPHFLLHHGQLFFGAPVCVPRGSPGCPTRLLSSAHQRMASVCIAHPASASGFASSLVILRQRPRTKKVKSVLSF